MKTLKILVLSLLFSFILIQPVKADTMIEDESRLMLASYSTPQDVNDYFDDLKTLYLNDRKAEIHIIDIYNNDVTDLFYNQTKEVFLEKDTLSFLGVMIDMKIRTFSIVYLDGELVSAAALTRSIVSTSKIYPWVVDTVADWPKINLSKKLKGNGTLLVRFTINDVNNTINSVQNAVIASCYVKVGDLYGNWNSNATKIISASAPSGHKFKIVGRFFYNHNPDSKPVWDYVWYYDY